MAKHLWIDISVRGCKLKSGEKFIGLKRRGIEKFVRRSDLLTNPGTIVQSLAEQGFPLGGRAHIAQLLENVREIVAYEPADILLQAGWNGPSFALPSGKVLVPRALAKVGKPSGVGYYRLADRNGRAGKLVGWQKIAPTVLQDDASVFIVYAALAPTIRGLMPGAVRPYAFELISRHDCYRLRRVAQSVIGSMKRSSFNADPIERLVNDPDRYIKASRDSLLMLQDIESHLCATGDKKRIAALREVLFDHLISSEPGESNATGEAAPVFMLVENKPLCESLSLDSASADRLAQTLITIDLNPTDDRFAYRQLEHSARGAPGWTQVLQTLSECYGVVLRAFQRRLVERREKIGLEKLQAELNNDFRRFCKNAKMTFRTERLPEHMVHPFALVYTAGKMAERLNVLPPSNRKPPSVWRIFKEHVSNRPKTPTAAAILTELAAHQGVLNINEVGPTMGKAELEDVPAFIKLLKSGKRELWVTTGQKKEAFDWATFEKLVDYSHWHCGKDEKGRDGAKRVIGGWKDARVVRFRLP